MKKFCYLCGLPEAAGHPLVEGLCRKCLLGKLQVVVVPSKIRLTVCRSCGAIKLGTHWITGSSGLKKEILKQVRVQPTVDGRTPNSISAADFSVEAIPDLEKARVKIVVTGKGSLSDFREEKTTKLEIELKTCETCSAKHGEHYEVIIQLRATSENDVNRVLSIISELESDRDFLVRSIPVRNGLDLYLSSFRLGKRVISLLKRRGFSVEGSKKLIGQTKDGQRRYRFTYLIKSR